MLNNKGCSLKGKDNKRLKSMKPTNNEATAAWANECETEANSKVSIPSLDSVEEAKEWVDNGSKL